MECLQQLLKVELCLGSSCYCRGNRDISAEVQDLISRRGWSQAVDIKGSLCRDACSDGPHVVIGETLCIAHTVDELERLIEGRIQSAR